MTTGDDAAALVRTVAGNVRALRTTAGLTLPELAERTGLGRSTLAQLESGRANPSVETLWAIAAALEVPFGRLVEPPAPPVRVVRAGEGVRLELEESALRTRLLATSPRRGSFELYVLEADPGQPRHAAPHSPGTVEHLLVTAGMLRGGPADHPEHLDSGDLLTFAADVAHLYEALAPGTAALLVMDYPQMGVLAIWRYPVKGMLGERTEAVLVGPDGPHGDRGFAVLDTATGERIASKRGATDARLRACRAALDAGDRLV